MAEHILIIDNYDSFTYNLYQMLGAYCPKISVFRNDKISIAEIKRLAPTHIVLSPGPGYPKDAGICEDVVREFHNKLPILGVCLGHQAICETFGGKIGPSVEKMHGKQSPLEFTAPSRLFEGIADGAKVARYHSLALDKSTVPDKITVTSVADDAEIMSVENGSTFGVQFHPESILTPEGAQMLKNFCN